MQSGVESATGNVVLSVYFGPNLLKGKLNNSYTLCFKLGQTRKFIMFNCLKNDNIHERIGLIGQKEKQNR